MKAGWTVVKEVGRREGVEKGWTGMGWEVRIGA
jgi:hypothetical protein